MCVLVLNDMTLYGMPVPLLEMAPCRIVSLCILLVNYGMYSLCIMVGVYYRGYYYRLQLHKDYPLAIFAGLWKFYFMVSAYNLIVTILYDFINENKVTTSCILLCVGGR